MNRHLTSLGRMTLIGSLFVPASGVLSAQALYGSIYGTVTDPSGAAVPNASIVVTDVQKGTQVTITSGADGSYRADHLIPDNYTVKVSAQAFAGTQSQPLEVHADTSQKLDIALNVEGSNTTVNVSAEAPPLQTDRSEVATTLNERTLSGVPNFTRNFTNFLLLTPGVQHSSFNIAGPENPQGGIALNSNGSNYGEQGFVLDGTDNRDPVLGIIVVNPTLDSISETRVITQNYDAEFGGAAGGIVSVSTKSGSNALHGDAFWYRHSDYFYARNPFTQFQADPVTKRFIPSELYSQFGGSLSGPIIKDKTFFFMDYQGLRQRLGTTLQQNVPTAQVRSTCLTGTGTCDLSQYTSQVLYNPVTKTPYSTTPGQLPSSAVSAQARTLLNLLPAPNAGSASATTNNYVASGNGVENGDQADVRIDHQATEKIHLFGRYDYALFRLTGVPVFGAAGGNGFGLTNTSGLTTTQNQSATAGFDWALKPTLLTDLRVGFLSYHVAENKYPGQVSAAALGIPNLNTTADSAGSPTFNFNQGSLSGLGNQGCNCPLLQSEQVFQVVNNWTKTFGNHNIRFGGDLRYAKNVRNASDYNRTGQFIFDAATTGQAGTSTGSDIASFLTGYAAGFQRFDVFINDQYSYQKRGAFYGQDTWRLTPKLTLNLGARWDIIFPETVNGVGHGGFASLATGGIRVAGAGGFGTNGSQRMDFTNVAARFGISYQATPRMVIRAGGGEVYDTVGYFGTLYGSVLSHNLPVQIDESQNQSGSLGTYVTTLGAPPVRPIAPSIPTNGIIPFQNNISQTFRGERIQLPRVHQYNVAVQQQLSNNMTFEIAYVGNLGDRIYPGETFGTDLNAPRLPNSAAELAAGSSTRRPYYNRFVGTYQGAPTICCSNGMTSAAPNGRAVYNSLQTKLDKRFNNGLQFNANYTWSRASNFGNDPAFTQYRQVTWGRNDTNRTNILVVNGVYELPFGKNRMFLSGINNLSNLLIGGWSLSGQTIWESGRPFTPTYAECGNDQDIDNNYSSPGTTSDCRPNGDPVGFARSVGGLNTASHARQFFTPVAALTTNGATSGPWTRPAFGTFGNSPRNGLVGPRDYYADASLMKDFPITERFKGQFQFQAFNVFNHAALDIPTATNSRCIDCTVTQGAGTITSLESNSTMRRLQFAARITF